MQVCKPRDDVNRAYVYGKLRLINAGLIFTVHPTPGDTYRGQCVVGLRQ